MIKKRKPVQKILNESYSKMSLDDFFRQTPRATKERDFTSVKRDWKVFVNSKNVLKGKEKDCEKKFYELVEIYKKSEKPVEILLGYLPNHLSEDPKSLKGFQIVQKFVNKKAEKPKTGKKKKGV